MEKLRKILSTWCLLALTTMVVSACGGGFAQKADSHTRFDKAAPDAIVVIGLQSTDRYKLFGTEGAHPAITLHWGRIDPGYTTPARGQSFSIDTSDTFLGMVVNNRDHMSMHVVRVPAGTYALRSISTNMANYGNTTVFPLKEGAPFFSVKPGEVRYIGDLHVNAIAFPAKIVRITRSDLLAKAELYKSPGIHVRPFFQGPAYYPTPDSEPKTYPVVSLSAASPSR